MPFSHPLFSQLIPLPTSPLLYPPRISRPSHPISSYHAISHHITSSLSVCTHEKVIVSLERFYCILEYLTVSLGDVLICLLTCLFTYGEGRREEKRREEKLIIPYTLAVQPSKSPHPLFHQHNAIIIPSPPSPPHLHLHLHLHLCTTTKQKNHLYNQFSKFSNRTIYSTLFLKAIHFTEPSHHLYSIPPPLSTHIHLHLHLHSTIKQVSRKPTPTPFPLPLHPIYQSIPNPIVPTCAQTQTHSSTNPIIPIPYPGSLGTRLRGFYRGTVETSAQLSCQDMGYSRASYIWQSIYQGGRMGESWLAWVKYITKILG